MSATETTTLAGKIASAARYGADARYHCAADVEHGQLVVTRQQWDHLPRRAKALGAVSVEPWRGTDHLGRARCVVVAADGSRCTVVRGEQ